MRNKMLKMLAAVAVIVLVCVQAFSKPQQNTRTTPRRANSLVLGASTPVSTPKATSSSTKNAFGKLPLRFEKNQGQSDQRVQYTARGGGYTLFLTGTEAIFRLNPPHTNPLKARYVGRNRSRKILAKQVQQASFVLMKLSDANSAPKIEAANMLPGTVNYLIGNDPRKWHTKVPTFGTVRYTGVYPGIDLVYYGNQRKLEYDFVVNPGGDPKKIAFEFDGATGVALSPAGDLKMDSAAGKLTARKPAVYQNQEGQRKPIDGKFVRREGNKIGVELGNYDPTKPLVIDPILDFSSYLGGSGDEVANAIAVDSQGFSYVTGDTTSVDFPTSGTSLSSAPGGTTISFVTKMNQTGTALVYSTYLGGTSTDIAMGIAVDASGQAYVDGLTSSTDFPVTSSNAFQSSYGTGATFNAFLAKLSADGQSLVYSTFLGGTGDDEGTGIAIDSNQNAYLTGYASSSNFPITAANAFQTTLNSTNGNAFVTRIDTTKAGSSSLIYSTFLGGSSPYSFSQLSSGAFGGDGALSIAVDANQNAFVVGEASSTDFPITSATAFQTTGNANNSVFLTRLDTNQSGARSLVYSTFIGGTGPYGDLGKGVALDLTDNAYVVGDAYSADFPLTVTGTNSANGKAFVAKFNTNLSGTASLVYSTLVGGTGGEQGEAIAVDPDGDAYIGGDTGSTDFPVTANAVQSALQGTAWNGFLAVLKPDASGLLYGTYLGGTGTGAGDNVLGLALDSHENLYVAGQTDSADFPTTAGAFQTALNGSTDAFVSEVTGIVTTPQISSIFPTAGGIGSTVIITGSSFGNSQGQSKVTFNGILAAVSSWSDGSITAAAPNGLSLGTATVAVTGNSVTSNGVQFTVTNPLFITPNQFTMVVGQSRPIQVLDQNGVPISNPTWTIAANSVAEIVAPTNQGDPILLQAVAPGSAILNASAGGRNGTARVMVLPAGSSLPIGSIQWSVPSLGSFGISNSVQALRVDDNTPDLYVEDDGALGGNGAIRAFTADGQQKWIWPSTAQDKFPLLLAADDQGGAIYFANQDIPNQFQSYCYFGRVDQNGNESWQYQESNCFEDHAIGTDGTIYLMEDDFQNTGTNVLTALDPTTGQVKFTIPLPGFDQQVTNDVTMMPSPGDPSTSLPYCTPGNTIGPTTSSNASASEHGTMSISSDGTLYIPLSGVSTAFDGMPCDSSPDPNNPGYTHVVNTSAASWTATANLYLMVVNPDGTHSIQAVDNRSRAGSNWSNASGPEYNIFAQRPVPDGQGGALLAVEQAFYHLSSSGSSKLSLPITVGSADPLLGDDGTAYVAGTSQNSSTPDTLLALDIENQVIRWSASPGQDPVPGTIMSDGSAEFQYQQSDNTLHLAVANSSGQTSPLFANPSDGSDVGPVINLRFGARGTSFWTLNTWFAYEPDGGFAATTGQVSGLSGSVYIEAQGNRQAQHGPQNLVAATFMPRVPGLPNTHPWGNEGEASAEIRRQISTVSKSQPFYSVTQAPTATTDAFIAENGKQPMDVLGFIGDSDLVSCQTAGNPTCFFSDGLIFVDRYLIRKPNCDSGLLLSLCYDLDTTFPMTNPPCTGSQLEVNGKCYSSVLPPCGPAAVQLGNYCFRFPITGTGLPAHLTDVLLTSSKTVFVASCEITDVFTGWWNLNLNAAPGGRALIVPDIAAMAALPTNQAVPLQNRGLVDLVQGATGYETFVKVFGTGKTAQASVDVTNQAIANLYPALDYSNSPIGPLPQVVYKVVGNPNVCVNCGHIQ